jgi:hypothetical protein
MTDHEADAIIEATWNTDATWLANMRAVVRAAACYGWRCAQAAHWLRLHSSR